VVKELMSNGADPNAMDALHHTPFMMSLWFSRLEAAREVATEKVSTALRCHDPNSCPCFSTIYLNESSIIQTIPNLDLREPNIWHKDPLAWARYCNRGEMTVQMIERRYASKGYSITDEGKQYHHHHHHHRRASPSEEEAEGKRRRLAVGYGHSSTSHSAPPSTAH